MRCMSPLCPSVCSPLPLSLSPPQVCAIFPWWLCWSAARDSSPPHLPWSCSQSSPVHPRYHSGFQYSYTATEIRHQFVCLFSFRPVSHFPVKWCYSYTEHSDHRHAAESYWNTSELHPTSFQGASVQVGGPHQLKQARHRKPIHQI